MLEVTSNFRISLDLITFGMNYGLKTADKVITGCTNVTLRYFGPLLLKCRLEIIDTLVFFSENRTLLNATCAKVQRTIIRRFW